MGGVELGPLAQRRLVGVGALLALLATVVGATAGGRGDASGMVAARASSTASSVEFAHLTDLGAADALTKSHLTTRGFASVEASPVSSYCAEAVAAWHGAGDYRAPTGFLTTHSPHDQNRCNGVPVAITFAMPAQDVTISFWGAALPYQLTAFDAQNNVIATAEACGRPYDYDDTFTISVHATGPQIARVVFGREKALTMIRSVTFVASPLGHAGV